MFEIEDISLGHHELFTVKYPFSVNGCPTSNMDLYLGSSTLQEMLDIDIKNEMDNDVFGNYDISFNLSNMDDSSVGACNETNVWFSNNSNNSNSNLFEFRNEDASRMVNPNSVMPIRVLTPTLASSLNSDIDTPSPKRSHLTFSPASGLELSNHIKQENISTVKKDLTESLDSSLLNETIKSELLDQDDIEDEEEESVAAPIVVQTKPNLPKPIHILTTKTVTAKGQSLLSNIKIGQKPLIASHIETITQPRQIAAATAHASINRKKKLQEKKVNPFPKPSYSYSCLIAMALKNSITGSLPVSEIYNFMCEHFPYFKTAPNGWKNSVRHNLSLNKCFEKIEKPAVSGSQRKGCLWAMNPDKISKMDEEVQKWSRKDPAAIRRAMVYPEHLEALERGELKYGSESYGDSSGSVASDSEEADTETEDIEVDNNITIREDAVSQSDYIEMNSLGDSYDEASLTDDYENENVDTLYEITTNGGVDLVTDDHTLRMEIALAQQELFNYQQQQDVLKTQHQTKRIRLSNVMYQPITTAAGRRKTPLIVRNNSNTSFIEIIGFVA